MVHWFNYSVNKVELGRVLWRGAVMTIHIFIMKFKGSISILSCMEIPSKDKNPQQTMRRYLFRSRIIRLWKSDDMRRLKDGLEKSLSFGRSGWWFVGMWSCGFLSATLMSFSSRGRGPSLSMASCSKEMVPKSNTWKGHRPGVSDFIIYQQCCSCTANWVEGATWGKVKLIPSPTGDLLYFIVIRVL